MGYKDILVFLDDGATNVERVNTAFSLAVSQQAHITGISVASMKPEHAKVSNEKALARISEQAAIKLTEEFRKRAEDEGVSVDTHVVYGFEDVAAKTLAKFARNFDLTILHQSRPDARNHMLLKNVAEQVILLSGRPVFFMPYIGTHHMPCKRAMIAWDGSPAASRAVHDAIPLLQDVDEVIILVIEDGKSKTKRGELYCDHLNSHLKRHQINTQIKRVYPGTFETATVILNELADNDVDMLVMGGYGTSSLKERIFGGVTRTLLSSMIVPVMMSH